MEPKYMYSESTVKPEAIQMDGDTVYLRTSITEVRRTGTQGDVTNYWTYNEAKLTVNEFNEYSNMLLMSNQKSGDNNQMIIMDAIADLYDVIATITTV